MPWMSTRSPGSRRPRVNSRRYAVANTVAPAAASSALSSAGRSTAQMAGTQMASAWVPSTCSPIILNRRHSIRSPATQRAQKPQDSTGLTTTWHPIRASSTPVPTASIVPAPSTPRTNGKCRSIFGWPCDAHRSAWLSEEASSRTRTSPGAGSGRGSSWRPAAAGPSVAVMAIARMPEP